MLRAARALTQTKVSRKRIHKALKELRRDLPDEMPLSGISITAVGDRVVVREGKSRWQVDDGQYVLGLDVSVDEGELHVVEVPAPDAIVRSGTHARGSGASASASGPLIRPIQKNGSRPASSSRESIRARHRRPTSARLVSIPRTSRPGPTWAGWSMSGASSGRRRTSIARR